jgi:hypothetical protein
MEDYGTKLCIFGIEEIAYFCEREKKKHLRGVVTLKMRKEKTVKHFFPLNKVQVLLRVYL